jgi:hypothetical protein
MLQKIYIFVYAPVSFVGLNESPAHGHESFKIAFLLCMLQSD